MDPEESELAPQGRAPVPARPTVSPAARTAINLRMQALLAHVHPAPLPELVTNLLIRGFATTGDGCVLFAGRTARVDPLTIERMGDRTGLECFVNQVELPLCTARAFVDALGARLRAAFPTPRFVVLVWARDIQVTGTFHVQREGEQWFDRDIEQLGDAGVWIERL